MSNQPSKALIREWNRKLKRSGFEDIENDKSQLRVSSTSLARRSYHNQYFEDRIEVYNARLEYYRMAEHFLYDHTFDNDLDKTIWQMHSEGISFRHIAEYVRHNKLRPKANKDNIQVLVKKLAKIMIEKYRTETNE